MSDYDHWKATEPEPFASIEDEMQALRNQLTHERGVNKSSRAALAQDVSAIIGGLIFLRQGVEQGDPPERLLYHIDSLSREAQHVWDALRK